MPEAGGIVAVESSLLPVSVVIDTVQSLIRGTGEVSIMAPERTPTETSPLLGPQANGNAVRPSNGAISGLRDPDTVFLSAADQTIIMASYGQIGSDLHALNLTSWIATSYFLTLTSFQPLYGKLSDIFGRKACLLWAYAIFGTGCLFCGLAQNIHQLIAARVFQGIGGGGMTTVVSILLSDIVPLRDRGVWQGGILADYIGWRWAFIAQAPMCVLAFTAVSIILKLPPQENSHWKDKLRRIDFPGAIILVGAVLGFLLGLDRGSNVSWTIPITIISLSVSAILFVLFVVVEVFYAAEPFAPGHIIFDRTFFSSYGCNFFSFGGWLAALFYIPLYFQAVDGVSATVAGLRLLPSILAGVTGSLFAGFVMKWTGKFYWLTVAAYSLLTLGVTVIFLFSGGATESLVPMIMGMVLSGFGNGIGVTSTLICLMVQQILRGRLRSALRDSKDIDRIVDGVRQSLDFIKTLDPSVAKAVRGCYGWAMNKGFAFMIAVVFFALVSSFFMREKKLIR
ncbi:hypothetical protein APSETT444_008164 [Aspergillus pseudonomiae]